MPRLLYSNAPSRKRKGYGGYTRPAPKRSNAYGTMQIRMPSLSASAGAQPKTLTRKLQYTGSFTTTDASNNTGFVVIRGNSCYDPEYALGGNQPAGFDELMALYNRFSVKASSCEAVFFPASTSAGTQQNGFVAPVSDPSNISATSVIRDISVIRNTATKPIGTVGGAIPVIKNYSTTKAMTGVSAKDGENQGDAASDPANEWYWVIGASQFQNAANATGAYVHYKIIYEVEFSDPKILALS